MAHMMLLYLKDIDTLMLSLKIHQASNRHLADRRASSQHHNTLLEVIHGQIISWIKSQHSGTERSCETD
jgi:hypothetical protein